MDNSSLRHTSVQSVRKYNFVIYLITLEIMFDRNIRFVNLLVTIKTESERSELGFISHSTSRKQGQKKNKLDAQCKRNISHLAT